MARISALDLSKYNIHDPALSAPPPGYVLIIDQTKGDASIPHSGASAARFAEMLALAQTEHPTARIVIKTHPETQSGLRPGHFTTPESRTTLCDQPVSPRRLLEGAIAVYTVSSQLGFEAILAGHRPTVLGQPFYAGWGLTDDRHPPQRRTRLLHLDELVAGALLLYPRYVRHTSSRTHGQPCTAEEAVEDLLAWRHANSGRPSLLQRLLRPVLGWRKS
jgi:capsular polysaccharide export protein